jgi:gliding motility-associated-like protein
MVNPVLTATSIGFVNNEMFANLTTQPVLATTTVTTTPVGGYPITVSGATSPNYTISLIDGTLTVIPTEQSIVIPNTFTPNGDGINDTRDIKFLNSYLNCSVEIYNRYGEIVYSSIGYGKPRDGTYKGNTLPTGTYYYIINLKNGLKVLSGFVAIVR